MNLDNFFYECIYNIKKNRKILAFFLVFFCLGIILGIFIAASTDSYLKLLSSSDNTLYSYIKGVASFSSETIKLMLKFFICLAIIFLLCLNFYSGLFSFLFVSYQSCLMFLSIVAIVLEFGFSGLLLVLFFILPVNVILFGSNIIFGSICLSRSYNALLSKNFKLGFDDKTFWYSIFVIVTFVVLFSILINVICILILRMRVFIIF